MHGRPPPVADWGRAVDDEEVRHLRPAVLIVPARVINAYRVETGLVISAYRVETGL